MADPVSERLFNRVFICMKCNARNRLSPDRVRSGKARCRKCGYAGLRAKKRSRKGKAK